MIQKISKEINKINCILFKQYIILFGILFLSSISTERVQDLVLTPKQGLQLHGKSIFYEDNSKNYLRNESIRPWERTLKHVTFVTLFPDVEKNNSKLQLYQQFLESPYIVQHEEKYTRFGDIVLLAAGWLERHKEGMIVKYRFLEGHCDQNCLHNLKDVVALWQVQKIRHRDNGNRKFSYEMKFSISLFKTNENQKDSFKQGFNNHIKRSYIQREDDYPQSFGRLIYPGDEEFAERISQSTKTSKQFKPEATVLESFLLPPPPLYRKQLNIGEYIRDPTETGISKIELFPNVFNLFQPHRQQAPIPINFPEEQPNFGDQNLMLALNDTLPIVMHHYHHHYYMPNSMSSENDLGSAEHLSLSETDLDRWSHLNKKNNDLQSLPSYPPLHQAPQKISTDTASDSLSGNLEPQNVVHHNQDLPFFPIKLNPYKMKPFIQSDKLTKPVHYSEPDPLYSSELLDEQKTNNKKYDENSTNETNLLRISNKKLNEFYSTTTLPTSTTSKTRNFPTKRQTKTTQSPNFVSSSSTQHAVREASRYRKGSFSTTTTKRPVKKWRSKNLTNITITTTTSEPTSKLNSNQTQLEKLLTTTIPTLDKFVKTAPLETTTEYSITTVAPTIPSVKNEIYEVLTKKSVSKSISIKVGKNGEELPVIDDNNKKKVLLV